jgi:hypothetical protein
MRTLVKVVVGLWIWLAACGGGSKQQPAQPAAAPAPQPVATAGTSCEQVADHVIEVALASPEYKQAKPEEQQNLQQMMPQLRAQIVQDCSDKPFPESAKLCIMKSQTINEMDGCEIK